MVGISGRMASFATAAVLFAALLAVPADSHAAEAAPAPALNNLAGEACRMVLRTDIAQDPQAPPPVNIQCGKAAHPSGAIALQPLPLDLPKDAAQRHLVIEKTVALSAAGRDAASRMACRPGKWVAVADKTEVFLRPCSLIDGNWPYLVAVGAAGGYLVQAEGLPANLPVLETAAGQLAGGKSASPVFGGTAKAGQLLTAAFGSKPPLVGSGDLDRFAKLAEEARLQNSRKDYRAAEDAYRQALLIQEQAQGPEAPGIGSTLMELALEVSNQGRFDEAAALFHRADPIIERSPNPADQGRYYSYLAYDAANAARYTDALAYARQAVSVWRDLMESNGPNLEDLGGDDSRSYFRGELAHSLNTEAAMALHTGDLAEAEASAKEALDIIGDEGGLPPWWRPEVLTTMGRVYAATGRLNMAEESFRGALVYMQRLFGETAPTASTLLVLSGIYADEGFYADSLRAYDFAMKILASDDLARSQVVFDQIAPVLLAATAVEAHQPQRKAELDAKMFEALQLQSAGVADQTIEEASARLAAGNPAIEQLVQGLQDAERKRDAARIELAHETSLPDDQRGSVKEAALLAEINTQAAQRDLLMRRITKEFPAYGGLIHPRPVPLGDLQARLQPREALLLFEIGNTRSFAVVVTDKGLTARPLTANRQKIESAVRDLRKAFTPHQGRIGEFDLDQSYALYRMLFGPVEKALAGIDRVVVVPGGALASLPMSLLLTAKPGIQRDYRHAAWLARRYATAELPSIRAFILLRDRAETKQRAGLPFLGIGNPAFLGQAVASERGLGASSAAPLPTRCQENGPIPAQVLRSLPPLPETASELRTVARALGAGDDALLLGGKATEAAFRKLPLGDARVLYFATHAMLPGELSCQSQPALALSPPLAPATTKATDGLLEASEIAGLQLHADLVVLSACNTAEGGTQFGGEALSGLAEAFFYAGARSLVASHWEVPSAATAGLMVGMFKHLTAAPAEGTAEALRQAQLSLMDRQETAHPFFWAAFTVIGDGGRLAPISAAADITSGGR